MFRAPNIKGPRFRKKFHETLNRDFYKEFLQDNPQYSDISYEKFSEIIAHGLTKAWNVTLTERDGIELPIGGSIFVASTKIKVKNNYDIQASIKANAPIKHRNYDTDGHVAKIYYSPHLAKIFGRDRSMWSFKGNRLYKRALSKAYPKNWKKYRMVIGIHGIIKSYHKNRVRNYFKESLKEEVKSYNEFE